MDYHELKKKLNQMTDEELDCDAIVHLTKTDVYFPVKALKSYIDSDVVDDGHVVIMINY